MYQLLLVITFVMLMVESRAATSAAAAPTTPAATPTVQSVRLHAIAAYNNLRSEIELAHLIFLQHPKLTDDDLLFIKNLKQDLKLSSDPQSPLKAKLVGSTLFLGNQRIKIEIISATQGIFNINGREIRISPERSVKSTFKEIDLALQSQFSKFNYLFMPQAHALGFVGTAALSVYGVGALISAYGCAAFNGVKNKKNLAEIKKIALSCGALAATWPYRGWKFYDGITKGVQIQSGECLPPSEKNPFGNLVHLKLSDDILSGKSVEIYLKPESKTTTVTIFQKPLNITNNANTTNMSKTAKNNEKKSSDIIEPLKPWENYLFVGDDQNKAYTFAEQLEKVCAAGGTPALNALIKKDSAIQNKLTELVSVPHLDPKSTIKPAAEKNSTQQAR